MDVPRFRSRKVHGLARPQLSGRVGSEIESGYPELWNYLRQRLEEARRKEYFAPQMK
jgi:hypothetical protein